MSVAIDKGIPIPPAKPRSRSACPNYPFHDMEPGDSFAVDDSLGPSLKAAATNHAKRYGKAFTTRLRSDGSIRCWRVR